MDEERVEGSQIQVVGGCCGRRVITGYSDWGKRLEEACVAREQLGQCRALAGALSLKVDRR
jgi:hypothetical protein